jgi:hypothetical protein
MVEIGNGPDVVAAHHGSDEGIHTRPLRHDPLPLLLAPGPRPADL